MRQSLYYKNLIKKVINASEGTTWGDVVLEWDIIDWEEDETLESSCVCGKENLRYLFTIKNNINRHMLYPIGSSCIKKFERNDLYETATIKEQLFRLLHAIDDGNYISLSPDYFSRKLLNHLYKISAFKVINTKYKPYDSYKLLLDMYNKRNKNTITSAQNKKINAIILNAVKPFLRDMLQRKIKQRGVADE